MSTPKQDSLSAGLDLEKNRKSNSHLVNNVVQSFSWRNLSVEVKDRATKKPMNILTESNGFVSGGELLAIMGPSGSGKTTLLNAIAHRLAATGATTTGDILINGQKFARQTLQCISSYVEQEDALIGSLTVNETMQIAAELALSNSTSKIARSHRVDDLMESFGLQEQRDTIVGTPIKKGISGGQKKRLGVASCLITDPKILFLDEPTSGLDSALSYEVIKYIRAIAKEHNLIVIASIHQPSTSTYKLFDKVALLSKGKTCFFGPVTDANCHFSSVGYDMPLETNPAEFYLDMINTDLARDGYEIFERVRNITTSWAKGDRFQQLRQQIDDDVAKAGAFSNAGFAGPGGADRKSAWTVPLVLLKRSWIKAYRDIVAYWIRIIMYLGLAILMGTVFLRLSGKQDHVQPFINAIFFGSAFMSFMAVAYVPAYLEDLHTYKKERANGLVGPFAFSIANFIIGLPFLFIIALVFSIPAYFLIGFKEDGSAFFKFILWLFLDLLAAEGLVVLVSAIFPIFVVALALTAFINGLWMCVDGFLVSKNILNPFWKYVFHYIDYQAYVFQGMMVNEFRGRTYDCERVEQGYYCMYKSELNSQGQIAGTAVLQQFGIAMHEGQWIGIVIGIIVAYRILAYLVLRLRY